MAEINDRLESIILKLQRESARHPPDDSDRILDAAAQLRDRLVELEREAFADRTQQLEDALDDLNEVSSRVQRELEDLQDLAETLNGIAELISKLDTVLGLA